MREELPETLNWYRESGNWLVGLSTGAIAAGLAFGVDLSSRSQAAFISLIVAGVCFILVIVLGVLFYFWIIKLGGHILDRKEITAAGSPRANELTAAASNVDEARQNVSSLYTVLLFAFPVGCIAAAIGTAFAIANPQQSTHYAIAGCDAAAASPNVCAVLLDVDTGRVWLLDRNSTGGYFWRAVTPPGQAAQLRAADPQ